MTDSELDQAINQATEEALEAASKLIKAQTAALELAYGLLWGAGTDTSTPDGLSTSLARQTLLATLDRDGQARGITAGREAFKQAILERNRARESRKNSRTADNEHRRYLPNLWNPEID